MKIRLCAVFVTALVAVPAAFAGASSGAGSATANKAAGRTTLVVYVSGDVNVKTLYTDKLIPGFEKANKAWHINLVFSEHGTTDTTTLARIGAAVKARHWPGIDLVDAGLVTTLALDGLDTTVSSKQVPNLKHVNPALLTPVKGKATPYRGSSVVLAYDSSHVSSPPKTLDALLAWIKSNPGKFTYNSPNTGGSGQSFVETVLDKYMTPSVITQMVNDYVPDLETNWKQGFDVLKSLKSSIYQGVYPNGNQAILDMLGKGQIWVAPVWSDQSISAKAQGLLGDNIKLTQISNPSFNGGAAYVGVPKTARHKVGVYKFINYMLQPNVQADIVNAMSGYPAIDIKLLNAAVKVKFADVQANTLRPSYSQKMSSDMKAQWQQSVP